MTLTVTIIVKDWTQVNSLSFGTVGNFGERDIHLREQPTKPSSNIEDGHILRPGENSRFSLSNNNNLWARAVIAPSKVLVSSGIDAHITSEESNILVNRLLINFDSQNEQIINQLKLINLNLAEMGNNSFNLNDIEE